MTLALGEEMLIMAGRAKSHSQARRLLMRALTEGRGLAKFKAMVTAQGGDPKVIDDYDLLPRARYTIPVKSGADGHVRTIDALQVGILSVELGAGRRELGGRIRSSVGFRFLKKIGDKVERDDVLVEVLASERPGGEGVAARLRECIQVSRTPPRSGDRVVARLAKS